MTRRVLTVLTVAALLASGPALASEKPAKDATPTGHYVEFSTLTATVLRPDRRRGVMAVLCPTQG